MKRRTENTATKAQTKKHRMENSGDKSNYAKKRAYLNKHGGWGFEYAEKPWK